MWINSETHDNDWEKIQAGIPTPDYFIQSLRESSKSILRDFLNQYNNNHPKEDTYIDFNELTKYLKEEITPLFFDSTAKNFYSALTKEWDTVIFSSTKPPKNTKNGTSKFVWYGIFTQAEQRHIAFDKNWGSTLSSAIPEKYRKSVTNIIETGNQMVERTQIMDSLQIYYSQLNQTIKPEEEEEISNLIKFYEKNLNRGKR